MTLDIKVQPLGRSLLNWKVMVMQWWLKSEMISARTRLLSLTLVISSVVAALEGLGS